MHICRHYTHTTYTYIAYIYTYIYIERELYNTHCVYLYNLYNLYSRYNNSQSQVRDPKLFGLGRVLLKGHPRSPPPPDFVRTEGSCRRCGVAKPSALASAAAAPSGGRPGDWTCTCGELVSGAQTARTPGVGVKGPETLRNSAKCGFVCNFEGSCQSQRTPFQGRQGVFGV